MVLMSLCLFDPHPELGAGVPGTGRDQQFPVLEGPEMALGPRQFSTPTEDVSI